MKHNKGKPFSTCFVDADHGGDQMTLRSRTGILIYVNKAPIIWWSKRQNTVETSTYGSELVALRISVKMIKALKYKLWMFGIDVMENETKIFCDNNSVVIYTSNPESTLKENGILFKAVAHKIFSFFGGNGLFLLL